MAAAPNALFVVELDDSEGDLVEAVGASREYLAGVLADDRHGTRRRRHHRRRSDQRHLHREPEVVRRHRAAGDRDLYPEIAAAKAEEYGVALHGGNDVVLNHPDIELVINLTPPGRPHRGARQRDRGRQARLEREATGPEPRERQGAAGGGRGRRPAGRLRTRHVPGRGPAGHQARAGQRRHRQAVECAVLDAAARPGPAGTRTRPSCSRRARARCSTSARTTSPQRCRCSVRSSRWRPWAPRPASGARSTPARRPVRSSTSRCRARPRPWCGSRAARSLTLVLSFDSAVPRILLEVTGTDASLRDARPQHVRRRHQAAPPGRRRTGSRSSPRPPSRTRGTGALDIARAIREDRPHRATGALAYHVLDVMVSIAEASESGQVVAVESTVQPSEPLPDDWDPLAATV